MRKPMRGLAGLYEGDCESCGLHKIVTEKGLCLRCEVEKATSSDAGPSNRDAKVQAEALRKAAIEIQIRTVHNRNEAFWCGIRTATEELRRMANELDPPKEKPNV